MTIICSVANLNFISTLENQSPRLIIAGMYRSGSTKVFNIFRDALKADYPFLESGAPENHDLDKIVLKNIPFLVKKHHFSSHVTSAIQSGEIRAVITIRDPLESMVSLCSTFSFIPQEAINETELSISCAEAVAQHACIIDYKTASSSNPFTIRKYLKSEGVQVSIIQVIQLSFKWNKRNSRARSRSIEGSSRFDWDSETLFHPNHIGGKRIVDNETRLILEEACKVSFSERFLKLSQFVEVGRGAK
jgi:hypothetical protein